MSDSVRSSAVADVSPMDPKARSTATLTGQLGAVQWKGDHTEIRLYCPTLDYAIQEYGWQGGDPWIQGLKLVGSSLASKAAAVHWLKDRDTHLRLYFQDTSNQILEECYDSNRGWNTGQIFSGSAYPGTGIAALALFDPRKKSIHLMLYYQTASNQIVEQYWDGDSRSGWITSHAFQGAASGTGIAAVYFLDGSNKPHKRLYYQDTNNLIVEQCWDGDQWALGRTFIGALAGTGIAATHWWHNGSHVRLYYQDSSTTIIEQCYDTESWTVGHNFTDVVSGTGIASVGWHDSDNHVRVYYKDAAVYEESYHAVIEQCYDDGQWTRGTFIARAS